jgi:hypothetical protein
MAASPWRLDASRPKTPFVQVGDELLLLSPSSIPLLSFKTPAWTQRSHRSCPKSQQWSNTTQNQALSRLQWNELQLRWRGSLAATITQSMKMSITTTTIRISICHIIYAESEC